MFEKRTKIICTIGPASSEIPVLTRMMKAGMNVARMNFSHGTHAQHRGLIRNVRAAAKKAGVRVAVLVDLQGPKIRLGNIADPGVTLRVGERITFSTVVEEYKAGEAFPVTYKQLHKDVKKGHRILMDDGLLEAVVERVAGKVITAKVTIGGLLKAHKGMNLPDSAVSVSPVTEKDWEDLEFGLEESADWVALSFVTDPKVVNEVRRAIERKCKTLKTTPPKIIAKIERAAAVDGFLQILDAVDAVMIARGDLGIEIPPEQVPIIQKEFVEICRQMGKPVVVATQMLDSMTRNPRATRAETSDVANAVIDHADAVMLSGETASGTYPDKTVQTMSAIIRETEASRFDDISFFQLHDLADVPTGIAQSLHVMAENGHIDAIVTHISAGEVSTKIGVFRPNVPIFLTCPTEAIADQSVLRAGIHPLVVHDAPGAFIHQTESVLRRGKFLKNGSRVAFVSAGAKEISLTIRTLG